jgi:hypothetical protein
MEKCIRISVIVFTAVLFSSCTCNCQKEVTDLPPQVLSSMPLLRFEKDLEKQVALNNDSLAGLHKRYGTFTELFCRQILNIRPFNDSTCNKELVRFANDVDIRFLKEKTDSVFADFSPYHQELIKALYLLKQQVPSFHLPSVIITFISAFNYRVITTDSILAVSLDMFLGSHEEEMYSSVGFPRYLSRKFSPDYLVVDAMRGWIQSEMPDDSAGNDLISRMIHYGKQQYILKQILPDTPDSILFGYTNEQMKWCMKEEAGIWAYFIEKNLLFNTQMQQYARYITDGPTTHGMPKESPGNIGLFIGYRLVKAYAEKNKATVEALLQQKDAHELMRKSGYRP